MLFFYIMIKINLNCLNVRAIYFASFIPFLTIYNLTAWDIPVFFFIVRACSFEI